MSDTIIADECCFTTEPLVLNRPAPDFTAEAYYRGERINVRLSELRGKWLVLFFYTADFTFV